MGLFRRLVLGLSVGFSLLEPATAKIEEHALIARIAVFPFKAAPLEKTEIEKTWWAVREELTRSKRFFVASRLLLEKKEVFFEREELKSVDTLILGKLLDCHAIMTGFIENNQLKVFVYSGTTGETLWSHALFLDPDVPLRRQFSEKAVKMVQAFMADIPYQGYQTVESAMDRPVAIEGDVKIAKVYVGAQNVQPQQTAQWVRVKRSNLDPLFQGGGEITVYAEGKVLNVEKDIATVEILRFSKVSDLKIQSLIRFPDEESRLREAFALSRDPSDQLLRQVGYLQTKEKKEPENKPLFSALSYIGGLILVLVLAL